MSNTEAAMPSDAQVIRRPQLAGTVRPEVDTVSRLGIFLLGCYFMTLALVTIFLLLATWPVSDSANPTGFADFTIIGSRGLSLSADHRLFLTVITGGALGSLIHSISSFGDYVGNSRLGSRWIWWLLLRTPVGILLALLFYLVLRGGLVLPNVANGSTAINTTQMFNPYGIAAISAMAGMFSKQATDKLREIFDTLFRTSEPVYRADPLEGPKPIILNVDPASIVVGGSPILNIVGRNFQRDCTATINGKARSLQIVSDTHLLLTLLDEDIAAESELELVLQNPHPAPVVSDPSRIQVRPA